MLGCGCVRFVEGVELFLFRSFVLIVVIGDVEIDLFGKVKKESVLKNCSVVNSMNMVVDGDGEVIGNFGNFL